MEQVRELTAWLLAILPLAVAARVIYCLCCLPTDAEQAGSYKRRIRNALLFLILAETVTGLINVIIAVPCACFGICLP